MILLISMLFLFYFLCIHSFGQHSFFYQRATPVKNEPQYGKTTIFFPAADGSKIESWLYLPVGANCPIIIMAPGLTSTKDCFLEETALKFFDKGIAVLLIDFRTFGGSEGYPRHWVSPKRQAEDYLSAIQFIKTHPSIFPTINTKQLAVWGSSFSGGVVLQLAAHYPDLIKAVIAQVPYLKNAPALEPTGYTLLRFIFLVLIDSFRARLNSAVSLSLLPPVYIPAFGKPAEFAFSKSSENISANPCFSGTVSEFWQRLPKQIRGGWENKMLARGLLEMNDFIPMNSLSKIRQPIYLISAIADDQVLHDFVIEAYHIIPHTAKKMNAYACRHYDIYLGEIAKENAENQAMFLLKVLSNTGEDALLTVT